MMNAAIGIAMLVFCCLSIGFLGGSIWVQREMSGIKERYDRQSAMIYENRKGDWAEIWRAPVHNQTYFKSGHQIWNESRTEGYQFIDDYTGETLVLTMFLPLGNASAPSDGDDLPLWLLRPILDAIVDDDFLSLSTSASLVR